MAQTEPGVQLLNTDLGEDGAPTNAEVRSKQLRNNFWLMAFTFSVNHSTVTTPFVFASSVLLEDVGFVGNAILNFGTMLSSLFVAPYVWTSLGSKGGMLVGMTLYAVYVACSAVAASNCGHFGEDTNGHRICKESTTAQWGTFVVGSIIGGLGAGILWLSEGAFFAATSEVLAEVENKPAPTLTAELAGRFAIVYLVFEVLAKLGATGLSKAGMSFPAIFFIYAGLAVAAAVVFCFAKPVVSTKPGPTPSLCGKVTAAVSLWPDVKIWLLAFTNLTFGFAAAFMNGYVNATFTSKQLGTGTVGTLASVTALVAAGGSFAFAMLPSKLLAVFLGSVCFFGIALICLIDRAGAIELEHWGWGLVVLYILQGLGRGVYESTNKGIFADFFPGPLSPGAFGNCMMQSTAAFTICFLLSGDFAAELVWVVLVLSSCTAPALAIAQLLKSRQSKEGQ